MEKEDLLRVQTIQFATVDMQNENGPFTRFLWHVFARRPLAQGAEDQTEEVHLLFDEQQLAQVKAWLLQLPLPDPDQVPGPPTFQ